MVQAAWLDKGKKTWALAVMSDENPTRSYAWTPRRVSQACCSGRSHAAYLAVVLE